MSKKRFLYLAGIVATVAWWWSSPGWEPVVVLLLALGSGGIVSASAGSIRRRYHMRFPELGGLVEPSFWHADVVDSGAPTINQLKLVLLARADSWSSRSYLTRSVHPRPNPQVHTLDSAIAELQDCGLLRQRLGFQYQLTAAGVETAHALAQRYADARKTDRKG